MDGTKAMAGSVVITVAFMGSLYLWGQHQQKERREHGPGVLESLVLAEADRPLWVAFEKQVEGSEDGPDEDVWRTTVYELDSGRILTRKTAVPWVGAAAADKGRLWCLLANNEVEVLSLPGLEVVHAAGEIRQKVGQKLMDASRLEVTEHGALRVLLADGRTIELAPDTLAMTPAPPQAQKPSPSFPGAFRDAYVCGLPNSGRSGVCRGYGGPRLDVGDGFLQPELIHVAGLTDRLVVLSHTSLDREASSRLVTVLDEQFKPVVQRPLAKSDSLLLLTHWNPASRTLVLGFRQPANTTVAIELDSGQERFRITH